MTTTPRSIGWLLAATVLLSLAACSSTVIREPGGAVSKPKPGASAVVRRGDTLYRIASTNGISVSDLAAWNRLSEPYTIYPGQRLRLYPRSGAATSTPNHDSTGRVGPDTARVTRPAPSTERPPAPPKVPAAPAAIDSGVAWRWPADGQLISRFEAGEPTRQGIDLAGTGGAPVRAAGDGVVVYSGSGLVGYGELIIIKHNDQWLSAYGHNRNRLVNEGQLVKAGQQIAELGRTGAARDMLHFEVRYNGKPVDPLKYLPKQ